MTAPSGPRAPSRAAAERPKEPGLSVSDAPPDPLDGVRPCCAAEIETDAAFCPACGAGLLDGDPRGPLMPELVRRFARRAHNSQVLHRYASLILLLLGLVLWRWDSLLPFGEWNQGFFFLGWALVIILTWLQPLRCPACGARVGEGGNRDALGFCHHCGSRIRMGESDPIPAEAEALPAGGVDLCGVCSARVDPAARFCIDCGARLGDRHAPRTAMTLRRSSRLGWLFITVFLLLFAVAYVAVLHVSSTDRFGLSVGAPWWSFFIVGAIPLILYIVLSWTFAVFQPKLDLSCPDCKRHLEGLSGPLSNYCPGCGLCIQGEGEAAPPSRDEG